MPLSLLILALSAFAIGTTEFVIMGLLPDVAATTEPIPKKAPWHNAVTTRANINTL